VIALAVALLLLAVLLAGPVPARLAASTAALRRPAPAVLAWQAIGAGTGLAAIGAALALAASGTPAAGIGLLAAAGLAGYLVTVTAWVTARTLARRRSHRDLLDLVGTPIAALPGGRLLPSATPMAYCVPGFRPRTVLTSAALARLEPAALYAVLAHERSHLAQRHDLVTLPFAAWQTALPFLPAARTARVAVALLVEALADDAARARVGAGPLTDALRTVALAQAPCDAAAPATTDVRIRLARLQDRNLGALPSISSTETWSTASPASASASVSRSVRPRRSCRVSTITEGTPAHYGRAPAASRRR
jgi:Zn-dependent protease with chaperone function